MRMVLWVLSATLACAASGCFFRATMPEDASDTDFVLTREGDDMARPPSKKKPKDKDDKKKPKDVLTPEEEEAQNRELAQTEYEDALSAIKAQDYLRAEGFLRKATQLNPEEPLYWNQLGRVLYWRKRYDDALTAYNESLRRIDAFPATGQRERQQIDGMRATVKANVGDLYREQQRFPESLANYREAFALAPNSVRLEYEVANLCLKTGDYEDAERGFLNVLRQLPDPASQQALKCNVGLAILYHLTQRNRLAFEQVTIIESNHFSVDPQLRDAIVQALRRDADASRPSSIWGS